MLAGLMQDRPLLLPTVIEHAAAWHGDVGIVSREADGGTRRVSYAEAATRARRLASALARLGIRAGDRVGALGWSRHRYVELFYGVGGLGAVLHTANPRLFAAQIADTVNHAGDRLLFVDPDCLEIAEAIRDRLTGVERYVLLTDRAGLPPTHLPDVICYEDLLAGGDADYAWPALDERSAASLCYTSGTTGPPKGVLYSHRASILQAMAVCGGDGFGIGGGDTILPVAPLFHCNGWSSPFTAPMTGAGLVLPGRAVDAASLCALIAAERVTLSFGVPTVWLDLLAHLDRTGGRLDSLRRVGCGGSAPPRALIERLARDHGVELVHAWGMTETTAACTFGRPDADETGAAAVAARISQGRAVFGCAFRVTDDAGRPLPRDGRSVGHIGVRGPWITAGYYRDDSGPAVDADGYLATGDVGTIDARGRMRITDRAKDVIKSGGEWISSIALENLAAGVAGVAEAAVVGVPHPKWQERPLLLLVPAAGAAVDPDAVRRHLAARVAKWWLPDDILVVDDLPRTATGKVLKTALRARYRDRFDAAGGRD